MSITKIPNFNVELYVSDSVVGLLSNNMIS